MNLGGYSRWGSKESDTAERLSMQVHGDYVWDRPVTWVPLLQCLHLNTPLLEWQNTGKLRGTRNGCVHVQFGQILNPRDTERPENTGAPFEEHGTKARCWEAGKLLRMSPVYSTPKGWGKHLSRPSSPTPGPTPTLTTYKEGTCPHLGSKKQGNLFFVLAPHCCSRSPNKTLPEFLSGL